MAKQTKKVAAKKAPVKTQTKKTTKQAVKTQAKTPPRKAAPVAKKIVKASAKVASKPVAQKKYEAAVKRVETKLEQQVQQAEEKHTEEKQKEANEIAISFQTIEQLFISPPKEEVKQEVPMIEPAVQEVAVAPIEDSIEDIIRDVPTAAEVPMKKCTGDCAVPNVYDSEGKVIKKGEGQWLPADEKHFYKRQSKCTNCYNKRQSQAYKKRANDYRKLKESTDSSQNVKSPSFLPIQPSYRPIQVANYPLQLPTLPAQSSRQSAPPALITFAPRAQEVPVNGFWVVSVPEIHVTQYFIPVSRASSELEAIQVTKQGQAQEVGKEFQGILPSDQWKVSRS